MGARVSEHPVGSLARVQKFAAEHEETSLVASEEGIEGKLVSAVGQPDQSAIGSQPQPSMTMVLGLVPP